VNRIIVIGARGFFGSAVVQILRAEGCSPQTASRHPGEDVMLDVEDRGSIRKAIRAGDVVVDATAPFQNRTATLVDECIAAGTDVVDLSDSLAYALLVWTRDSAARERGVRVLNACSSVSVLSALAIERSGFREPIALHGFLAPATRHTANQGAAESLLATVGRTITVWRDRELKEMKGWLQTRKFASLRRRGNLTEMADAFTLSRVYPSLRDVDFWVDPNTRGARTLLGLVARMPTLSPIAAGFARYGTVFARILGSDEGVLAYEIEGTAGEEAAIVFTGPQSFLMAAIPAALAAMRLASGRSCPAGIVPVNRQVDMDALGDGLTRHGIRVEVREGGS